MMSSIKHLEKSILTYRHYVSQKILLEMESVIHTPLFPMRDVIISINGTLYSGRLSAIEYTTDDYDTAVVRYIVDVHETLGTIWDTKHEVNDDNSSQGAH